MAETALMRGLSRERRLRTRQSELIRCELGCAWTAECATEQLAAVSPLERRPYADSDPGRLEGSKAG